MPAGRPCLLLNIVQHHSLLLYKDRHVQKHLVQLQQALVQFLDCLMTFIYLIQGVQQLHIHLLIRAAVSMHATNVWSIETGPILPARMSNDAKKKLHGPHPSTPLGQDGFLKQVLCFASFNQLIDLLIGRLLTRYSVVPPVNNVAVLVHDIVAEGRKVLHQVRELLL